LTALLAALALGGSTGCIVILGSRELPGPAKIIEIDGELYVVDLESRRLHRIGDDCVIEEQRTGDAESSPEAEPTTDTE
jgi:hypothetical protein